LLLVRVEGRRQELAVRSALGAGWRRIAGDLLFESVVLAVLGGVLGLGLAYGGLQALLALAPSGLPRIHDIGINLPVLLFALGLAIVAGLLIGLIPVVKFAGGQVNAGLREGGRSLSQSRERHRARSTLVVVQVALALVLLICSGLMIRTFRKLEKVDPGFAEPSSLQTFRIFIPSTQIPDSQPEKVVRTEQAILDKLAALPGVKSAGITTAIPMGWNNNNDLIFARDRTYRGTPLLQATATAHANGIGDIALRAKYKFLDEDKDSGTPGLATVVEARLPTGDEQNLLGAGKASIRATLVAAYELGRVDAYANIGVVGGGLSNELQYRGAVDFNVSPRVTVVGELVGRRLSDVGRIITTRTPHPTIAGVDTIRLESDNGSSQSTAAVAGVKWNIVGTWLLGGSVAVPLTDSGLRSRVIAQIGLDYAFTR